MTYDQKYPMIPPNILLNNWESDWFAERENVDALLTQAYQSGADAELEACCEWLSKYLPYFKDFPKPEDILRAARRPKPKSLKEQALALMDNCIDSHGDYLDADALSTIRRALEALPDDL